MAIVKIADRGVRNSTSTGTATVTLTNPTLIVPGSYLIARVAVDNSGASGARPGLAVTDSRSHTWVAPAGALQDPGAASAGSACYLCYVKVVTAYQAGDTVVFTWTTGTPVSAIVIEEWTGIRSVTPEAVAQATANNVSTTAQPTAAITPTAANQLVYVACANEGQVGDWGAQDADSTNGTWSDLTKDTANTGTHDTSMSVYGGYKVVTASGAQTWNNTLGVTGDWSSCVVVFANELDVPEFAHRRRFQLRGEDEPYFYRPKPKSLAALLYVPPVGDDILPAPSAHLVESDDESYSFYKPRRFNPAFAPGPVVGGAVSAGVAVVVTAAGVGAIAASDILTAPRRTIQGDPPEYRRGRRQVNPALYAVAVGANGVALASSAVVVTAAGSRQASGVISARVAVVTTAAGSKQTTAAQSLAPNTVTARATESRQASGQTVAAGTVVVKTTGAQGVVVGGVVSARLTVVTTAAGSKQITTGATVAAGAVVATPTEKRQTTGQTVAAVTAIARTTGGQGAVVGGRVTATCTVVVRTAGVHGGAGFGTANGTAVVLASGKRAVTVAAVSARFAVIATALGRKGSAGQARAVGAVYAMPAHSAAVVIGDVHIVVGPPSAHAAVGASGASIAVTARGGDVYVTSSP